MNQDRVTKTLDLACPKCGRSYLDPFAVDAFWQYKESTTTAAISYNPPNASVGITDDAPQAKSLRVLLDCKTCDATVTLTIFRSGWHTMLTLDAAGEDTVVPALS